MIPEHNQRFLKTLLDTPSPSGNEQAAAAVWRAEARTFADQVRADANGNSFALLENGEPRVLLAGHIDEIGLMISYIDEQGFLYFQMIGGWDEQVLVGQRVRLNGRQRPVTGVIGKKPIHLMREGDRDDASKAKDLWVDIGAQSRDEVLELLDVGCVGVLEGPPHDMLNQRLVSRSLDDRIGAFVVLEALRELSQNRPLASVAAVATTQEEIALAGAATAAFSYDPQIALVVDVTFATDHPDSNKKQDGDVQLGGGPVLSHGAANSPLVVQRLFDIARHEHIPYSIQVTPRRTGTDADIIYRTRQGVATAVLSIPCRYMHTPNEMVSLSDVEHTIRLIVAFVASLQSDTVFIPEE